MQGYLALCLEDSRCSTPRPREYAKQGFKTRFYFSYCTRYNYTYTQGTVVGKLFQTFHLVYLDGQYGSEIEIL